LLYVTVVRWCSFGLPPTVTLFGSLFCRCCTTRDYVYVRFLRSGCYRLFVPATVLLPCLFRCSTTVPFTVLLPTCVRLVCYAPPFLPFCAFAFLFYVTVYLFSARCRYCRCSLRYRCSVDAISTFVRFTALRCSFRCSTFVTVDLLFVRYVVRLLLTLRVPTVSCCVGYRLPPAICLLRRLPPPGCGLPASCLPTCTATTTVCSCYRSVVLVGVRALELPYVYRSFPACCSTRFPVPLRYVTVTTSFVLPVAFYRSAVRFYLRSDYVCYLPFVAPFCSSFSTLVDPCTAFVLPPVAVYRSTYTITLRSTFYVFSYRFPFLRLFGICCSLFVDFIPTSVRFCTCSCAFVLTRHLI